MSAVFGAFMQYLLTAVYYIAIAGLGIFAGKKLCREKRDGQSAENRLTVP